jgi:hypothetical protein
VNAWVRGLLVLALSAGVLGSGAVGLCGGYFTASFIPALLHPGGAAGLVFLALSVPCLMGGLFMVWVCIEQIRRTLQPPPRQDEPHEQ